MIDWLNIEVPLVHSPIPQGRRLTVDHDGEVLSDFVMGRHAENYDEIFEGSYSSKVIVSSIDSEYTLSKAGNLSPGLVSGISIKGNPTKFLQGHNVFGIDCIRTLAVQTALKALPQLGFKQLDVERVVRCIKTWQFFVSKIDITHMFDLGTDADVRSYIRMLPLTATSRGERATCDYNTWYLGKHSGLWSLKMYNKYLEIMAKSKKHQLPKYLQGQGIEQFAFGKLRAELVLHRQVLKRMGMTSPELLQKNLKQLFEDYVGKVEMRDQKISEIDVMKLPNAIHSTFVRWKRGEDLRAFLPKNTYYRHRRELLQYGVDIKLRPIPENERIAVVRPLKVLTPKMVVDVPHDLHRFMVKKVA